MTTAAAPRRPSPADMPRKTAAAGHSLMGTAAPLPGRSYRSLWEQAVLSSNMPPPARLTGIALATHADPAGQIAHQPRLIGLVHETGLHVAQVAVALTTLRGRGLLRQTRRADRYETADFILTIPTAVMSRLQRTATQQKPVDTSEPSA
ncbi:hypothetical protein [Streptomyces nitrosporeus]|uniref:hypothetical protein n=1 Tax=Streptomyces nitrosporeus TaxID=28894 RepID=UPI0039A0C467